MNENRKNHLLKQFENDQLDKGGAKEFLEEIYLNDDKDLIEDISSILTEQQSEISFKDEVWENMLHKIVSIDKPLISKGPIYRWLSVAASLLLISFACFYFISRDPGTIPESKSKYVKIISPANDQAVLTLANGEKVTLDSNSTGSLTKYGHNAIINHRNGQLEVMPSKSSLSKKTDRMLMVETPRGGKYMVTLPDGSKVWLNAASSIQFPEVFSKMSREVYIQGEAYFEVVSGKSGDKSNKWPFVIKTGKHVVEVLGTHFDINAYKDENEIKTTLLEGSVNVYEEDALLHKKNRSSVILKPGEQSVFKTDPLNSTHLLPPVITIADIEKTMAWKSNLFKFKNSNIQSIMRELSRWYNVEIAYETEISKAGLTGYISRDVPVERVLKMLEATSNMSFIINEGTIFVKNTRTN